MKIPSDWFNLFKGDRMHTTLPYHRILEAFDQMKADGFAFEAEPSARGYWILCRESPNKSPYVPSSEAA